jgi:hypothetical protein
MGGQSTEVIGGVEGEQDLGPTQIGHQLRAERGLEGPELIVVGLM